MLKNYLKLAWRNILKHKQVSLIHLLGLSTGLTGCLLIFLYVHFEQQFDMFNTRASRIARITTILHAPESDLNLATTSPPLATAVKQLFPEVENTVRLESQELIIRHSQERFREEGVYQADPSIFKIFSFTFLEGNPEDAFTGPGKIVLSHSLARKYFGNSPAAGKYLVCNDVPMMVTAVIADRPANSEIKMNALVWADYSKSLNWADDLTAYTFVLFRQAPDLKAFEKKLQPLAKKFGQADLDAADAPNYHFEYRVQALADVHFTSGLLEDLPKGNRQQLNLFIVLAIFILLIAILNYINLSTARAVERAREVGVRKVHGASAGQLVVQFLFEFLLLILFSGLISLGLMALSIPLFNRLLNTSLHFSWQQILPVWVGIILATTLLAGLYPAIVLSNFKPIRVLKGQWKHGSQGVWLRKSITVLQFAVAAALVLGTTIVYRQLVYIKEKDLGYNQRQLVSVFLPDDSAHFSAVNAFHDALRRNPEFDSFTVGSMISGIGMAVASTIITSEGKKREIMSKFFQIDPQFVPVMQINMKEGRNISDSFTTDKNEAFLVNEAFLKWVGWKSAVGRSIEGFGRKGTVVGVIKNFYFESLHNLVEPLVLMYNRFPNLNATTLRIRPGSMPRLKKLYSQYFPDKPLDFRYVDDMLAEQYEKDQSSMKLFTIFTLLAIWVAASGIYGLVSLIGIQRMKEVVVRKILGASGMQLALLLSKDFVVLAGLSLILALPLAAWFMQQWLQGFAYHISPGPVIFLFPVAIIFVVTLLVIYRDIRKLIRANPAERLRME